jgi:hypothetical protein
MKLYKFRPLGSDTDFERAKSILNTKKFHCAHFWELNDPMEGVYYIDGNEKFIDAIYRAKKTYRICSFSANITDKGFDNPTLWGYYANGFRGLVIKIDVEKSDVCKIDYVTELIKYKTPTDTQKAAKKILITKLSTWEHEAEWRFLTTEEGDKHQIGNITSVYFGNPYKNTINYNELSQETIFRDYENYKRELFKIAKNKHYKTFNVAINNNRLEISDII